MLRADLPQRDGRRALFLGILHFIGEPCTDFAVVSIGISPNVLFHPRSGLFMLGNNVVDTLWKNWAPTFGASASASVEFFETDTAKIYRNQSGFCLLVE